MSSGVGLSDHDTAQPGDVNYLSSLLNRARISIPSCNIEPVVLESLLLCLVAGPRNLILRANSQDDVGPVVRMTALILATIFGLSAHKHKVRGPQPPAAFLRALLLPSSNLAASPTSPTSPRPHTRPRTLSRRSGSATHFNSDDQINTGRRPDHHAAQRTPVAPAPVADADPTVPEALVISGLEHAGAPAQRALMQALADRKFVLSTESYAREGSPVGPTGTWSLPDNFMVVYVCTYDERDRPGIQRGLLDQFSLSTSVPRQAPSGLTQGYTRSRSDIGAIITTLSSRSLQFMQNPPSAGALLPAHELAQLRWYARDPNVQPTRSPPDDMTANAKVRVELHPNLERYAADLVTQARHHPVLDGTLIGVRAHRDISALLRASRVVRGESGGGALLRAIAAEAHALAERGGAASTMEGTWEEEDGLVDETLEGERMLNMDKRSCISELENGSIVQTHALGGVDSVWNISDENVRAIVPGVLRHRLAVRAGPEEQVLGSILYGAVPPRGQENVERTWERPTVEEVLLEILEDRGVI